MVNFLLTLIVTVKNPLATRSFVAHATKGLFMSKGTARPTRGVWDWIAGWGQGGQRG